MQHSRNSYSFSSHTSENYCVNLLLPFLDKKRIKWIKNRRKYKKTDEKSIKTKTKAKQRKEKNTVEN